LELIFIIKKFKILSPTPLKKLDEVISANDVSWVCSRYGERRGTYKASVR